jgi:hypothetical protein
MYLTSRLKRSRGALGAGNFTVRKVQRGLGSDDVVSPKEFRTSLGSFQQRNAPLSKITNSEQLREILIWFRLFVFQMPLAEFSRHTTDFLISICYSLLCT